jgi:hypothetical protein
MRRVNYFRMEGVWYCSEMVELMAESQEFHQKNCRYYNEG